MEETHVFRLHARQRVFDATDANPAYLDSQTISPGATFSYDIEFGGSGNRNLTPGDSIFHCHLYPHFAQGMWELWRTCPDQAGRTDEDYEADLRQHHDLCGAQRTTQRWWADPILNRSTQQDGTLRTVFTYAGLVIEPANSVWANVGKEFGPENWNDPCPGADQVAPACDRLIGGSDLRADPPAPGSLPLLGGVLPRPPLLVREDGGPTT